MKWAKTNQKTKTRDHDTTRKIFAGHDVCMDLLAHSTGQSTRKEKKKKHTWICIDKQPQR
jgi:hypothetical protein